MKVYRETSEHLWLLCPSHKDVRNPNLCVNKTDCGKYPKGFAYCFACGYTTQFSEEAVDKMSKKKSICREKRPIDWENLVNKYKLDSAPHIEYLAKQWKINYEDLLQYNAGWDGTAITFPMSNENENIIGISRRFPDGSKSCMEGSQLGLFISMMRGYKVVITEGFSDAAVASHLGYFGIGKPCASFGENIVRKYLENIEYNKEVIIVQDNDEAGQRSTDKLQLGLRSQWDLRIIVPEIDLKAYYLKYGFDKTVALLELGG
jgi:DNA primase